MYYTVYFLQIQVHIIIDDMYTGKWQLEITRYRDYVEKYKHFDRKKNIQKKLCTTINVFNINTTELSIL